VFGLFSRKGPFRATIASCGQSVEVQAGENLLKAALGAGLAWPYDCRVGSCGTCRCRLVEGKIKALNDFSYVLDDEELDRGMILACQTSLRSDVVVEVQLDAVLARTAPAKAVGGAIASAQPLTHDIMEIRVRLDEPLPAYAAGQYAEILVSGIDKPRAYSFARAPDLEEADHATFHVRHVPGGAMSGWLHTRDRTGERVTLAGPYGSFCLRNQAGPMLCIAGGSGMAPIKALLEQLAGSGFGRQVTYLYGARARRDLYCLDEMNRIKARCNGHFRFIPVLSNEPQDTEWTGARGMVTEHIGRLGLDLAACQAYLCGPPPMIDAAVEVLTSSGVRDGNIHFDKFLDASTLPGGRR